MSEKRKIQRFNLDEGRIWEAIEGLSPFKTTYTLEEVCEKLNEQQATINELQGQINRLNYIIEELRKNNYNKFELINKMKKEEKLYAEEIVRLNNEIGELRETNKEWLQFKSLGGDY